MRGRRMTDWTPIAAAVLAEVGLTFDDVYDLGREWRRGPPGFEFMTARPAYRGICHPPARHNPTARQRCLIGLTGPVDCETMLSILAHECGHVSADVWGSSRPEYIQEADAERYAHEALRRHLGREPHQHIVDRGRKYVRAHCWSRYRIMGPAPTKRWVRTVVESCGFNPPEPLEFI